MQYINGTQTASTSAWTGVTTKLTSTTIPTGTIIYYRLNQSSTSTNVTLELKLSSDNTKTTGAKAVYLDDRRVTTHFRLGSIIPLRYDGANWIVISPYTDNNTTYTVATQSANGLLSSTDKKKLDGITESADSVSFTQTKTSGIEIGKININGTSTTLYQQDNNTTYTAESTATNIKMNGTQSAGSLATYARGDHVHPSDTSKLNKVQDTLAEGIDLNTIVNAGWYKNNSNAQVQKMKNTPWQTAPPSSGTGTGWAFALFVLKSYGTIQFLFPYNSTSYQSDSKYKAYYRVNYNNDASNAWTQWFTLLDTEMCTYTNGQLNFNSG